jgi:FecR-like protein
MNSSREGYLNISRTRFAKVISVILTFVIAQVFLGLAFAAPGAGDKRIEVPFQGGAVLTTQGNKPISVNGASATSGATILTGATIETPDGVSATVTIPGRGTLMIPANTKLTVDFDQAGRIHVTLLQGCVVLNTKKGTSGEVDSGQGAIGKSDGSKDASIDTCQTRTSPATAAGGGGLSTGAKVAIAAVAIGGGTTALAFALRGSNPSPTR